MSADPPELGEAVVGIALKARWRLCYELAEQIERQFDLRRTSYDVDQAAALVDSLLPDTYDELAEKSEDLDRVIAQTAASHPEGESPILRLRRSLSFGPEVSLGETLRAAAERIENPNRGVRK